MTSCSSSGGRIDGAHEAARTRKFAHERLKGFLVVNESEWCRAMDKYTKGEVGKDTRTVVHLLYEAIW